MYAAAAPVSRYPGTLTGGEWTPAGFTGGVMRLSFSPPELACNAPLQPHVTAPRAVVSARVARVARVASSDLFGLGHRCRFGIALCLYTAESSAETVCSKWRQKLPAGSRKMTVKMMKRNDNPAGKIHSGRFRNLPSKKLRVVPQGGACPGIGYPKEKMGACLWAGLNSIEGIEPGLQSGWVTGSNPVNCGHRIFANKGNTRAEGTVVDVCTFDENDRKLTIEEGCSMIYVTRAMFRALGGKSGADSMVIDNWDFIDAPK
ncbi:hypothetical protein PtB15_6B783 [Puccinia triticina]|nr:hypothetical protein PtB15_6B783 [Puccinia triticina]